MKDDALFNYDPKVVEKERTEAWAVLSKQDNLYVSVPCPVCYNLIVHNILTTTVGKLGHCDHCGMVYSHVRMSTEGLRVLYKHFLPGYLVNDQILAEDRVRRPLLNNLELDIIEQYSDKGVILDIGACGGDFLLSARLRGWEVWAQELSAYCRKVLDHYNIPTVNGFVYETKYPRAKINVVTLRHTLEHLPAPRIELEILRNSLVDGGILFIVVPMWLGLEHAKAGGHNLPQHVSHFTEETLSILLHLTGFEILSFEEVDSSRSLVDPNYNEDPINYRVVARKATRFGKEEEED